MDRSYVDLMREYDPARNRSVPVLTPFERAGLIACRAQQLAMGAPTTLGDVPAGAGARDVARAELAQRKMPLMVCRKMPDGSREIWRLRDLHDVGAKTDQK